MPKKYELILFDMDGTLADTDEMLVQTFKILCDKYNEGRHFPKERVIYFSGPPIQETIDKEFKGKDCEAIFQDFREISRSLYASTIKRYPDCFEVLTRLKEKGYHLGIVTNKNHRNTDYVIELLGLENIFEIIVAYDDVSNGKPDKEGIEKACSMLNISKEKSIYIGDNTIDLLSADNAGVDCYLVNWGPRKLVLPHEPTGYITSYLDLERKLTYDL